jgi:phosphopantetheine--protein transferase-like protein
MNVGCDAELIEPRSRSFVADFFSRQERDAVDHAQADRRALTTTLIWSAKESVLKALQEGLRLDTRSVVVDIPLEGHDTPGLWHRFTARDTNGSQSFSGWWLLADHYVYTVASKTADGATGEAVGHLFKK